MAKCVVLAYHNIGRTGIEALLKSGYEIRPLFRQGGATVCLRTRLSVERDQGGSIFIGRFVEAIRETLIRRDVWGML